MANIPNPRDFELAVNTRIEEAIQALLEKADDQAFGEYGGRLIRFKRWWHSIDPEPTVIETAITNAYFDQSDEGGRHLMFEVVVRDPRTGRDTTITHGYHGVEFI
jgi:hypothetical protein